MIREMFSAEKYTTEELMARLKFFIGIILGLTLFGIVFVVLYSLIFVVQPMNGISPVDNKFFELIIPIATFLTGTLSGIMLAGDDKELRKMALESANKAPTPPSPPTPPARTRPIEPTMAPPGGGSASLSTTAGFNGTSVTITSPPVAPFTPSVSVGFGGKPAPVQPPQPEL